MGDALRGDRELHGSSPSTTWELKQGQSTKGTLGEAPRAAGEGALGRREGWMGGTLLPAVSFSLGEPLGVPNCSSADPSELHQTSTHSWCPRVTLRGTQPAWVRSHRAQGSSSGLPQSCHTHCHCPGLLVVSSSPRVFGQDGSGAAPTLSQSWRSAILDFTPLPPVRKELQSNEGGWQAQARALGMDSSILTPVKNVPGLKKGASCVKLELGLKARSSLGLPAVQHQRLAWR